MNLEDGECTSDCTDLGFEVAGRLISQVTLRQRILVMKDTFSEAALNDFVDNPGITAAMAAGSDPAWIVIASESDHFESQGVTLSPSSKRWTGWISEWPDMESIAATQVENADVGS